MDRRRFIKLVFGGTVALIDVACSPGLRPSPTAPASPAPVEGASAPDAPLTIAVTPTDEFYSVSIGDDPSIDPATWRLTIDGLVSQPLHLTLDDLRHLPAVHDMRTLECISNPPGGRLIGNTIWTGTPLLPLLREAGIKPEATHVIFHAADQFSTGWPLSAVLRPETLIVYEMNDAPLPKAHGFPARMMIPGVYGMKQAKWITRVELIDRAYLGYWESQGWSNTAVVRVNSGITMPEEEQALPQGFAILRGFAFADESGITGVDVSTDGGRTWQPCELLPGPTTRVWSMWRYRWAIPGPGKYRLVARATDGHGVTQAIEAFSILNGTFPNGTSAAHSISVTVGS